MEAEGGSSAGGAKRKVVALWPSGASATSGKAGALRQPVLASRTSVGVQNAAWRNGAGSTSASAMVRDPPRDAVERRVQAHGAAMQIFLKEHSLDFAEQLDLFLASGLTVNAYDELSDMSEVILSAGGKRMGGDAGRPEEGSKSIKIRPNNPGTVLVAMGFGSAEEEEYAWGKEGDEIPADPASPTGGDVMSQVEDALGRRGQGCP